MSKAIQFARALGGEACGNQISAPGPGHSPKDRSLSVKIDANAPDGFVVRSFASDDPIDCRDYVRSKCGLASFKPRKRGPSFSARRRAWRDKIMSRKIPAEYKVVAYAISRYANYETATTFVKPSRVAREYRISPTMVTKAFDWLTKFKFIKTGKRPDGTPYAILLLGNSKPEYQFSAGSFDIGRWFARLHGGWLDEIFLSTELSPGDKLTAYAVLVSTDPETGSSSVGYPTLVKAVGICERTAKTGVRNLERARCLEVESKPGKHLALYPCLRVPTEAMRGATTQAMERSQVPNFTAETIEPPVKYGKYDFHKEDESLIHYCEIDTPPEQPDAAASGWQHRDRRIREAA